jgi:hypothetical protein
MTIKITPVLAEVVAKDVIVPKLTNNKKMESKTISNLAIFEFCHISHENNKIVKSYQYEVRKSDFTASNAVKVLDCNKDSNFTLISKNVTVDLDTPNQFRPDTINIQFHRKLPNETGVGKEIAQISPIKLDEKSIENGLKRAVNILNQLEKLSFEEFNVLYVK